MKITLKKSDLEAALKRIGDSGPLAATERLEIFDGILRPGRYEVYLGYYAVPVAGVP